MAYVTYETEGAVAIATIDRPKALNALNSEVLDDLAKVIDGIDLDTIRCLILTGAGDKSFVAGADIGEMSTLTAAEGEASDPCHRSSERLCAGRRQRDCYELRFPYLL